VNPTGSPQRHEKSHRKAVIVNAATGVALRALPRIPASVQRLLLGRRSVILDGNTLDTTLQLAPCKPETSFRSTDVAAAQGPLRTPEPPVHNFWRPRSTRLSGRALASARRKLGWSTLSLHTTM
jgi:hypothetical protein